MLDFLIVENNIFTATRNCIVLRILVKRVWAIKKIKYFIPFFAYTSFNQINNN